MTVDQVVDVASTITKEHHLFGKATNRTLSYRNGILCENIIPNIDHFKQLISTSKNTSISLKYHVILTNVK